jgi:peptidyl-prolyl cis-trans isomerase B (cyclophilin B)
MAKKKKSKIIATTILIIGLAVAVGSGCRSKSRTEKAPSDTNKQHQTQKEIIKEHPVQNTQVRLTTNYGDIVIELDTQKAPVTTANFLEYVEQGHYDDTIFHRVIPGFMIQGGGFTADMQKKKTNPPIKNEASNGLKNLTGTLAMARTNNPDSATSQFFISLADNVFLDYTAANPGYAVFGRVIEGMDTVNKIDAVKTGVTKGMKDVPIDPVVIESAKLVTND